MKLILRARGTSEEENTIKNYRLCVQKNRDPVNFGGWPATNLSPPLDGPVAVYISHATCMQD